MNVPAPPRVGFGRLAGLAALALLLLAGGSAAQPVTPRALFDGTLEGWTVVDSGHANFTAAGGILTVAAPEGWLRATGDFADFLLEVEFRFLTDDADSGVFFRVAGDAPFRRGWPNQSYQLQMMNPLSSAPFPPLGGLFRHGMPNGVTAFDESLARSVTRGTGQWQTLTLEVRGATVQAAINGRQVLSAGGIGNRSGGLGLQGETGALEFRAIRITEFPAAD